MHIVPDIEQAYAVSHAMSHACMHVAVRVLHSSAFISVSIYNFVEEGGNIPGLPCS